MTRTSNDNHDMINADAPEILDVLRAGPVGVSSTEEMEEAKERMLPWLEQQVEALPLARARHDARLKRQRMVRVGSGVLLAAAGIALALFASERFLSSPESEAPVASATDVPAKNAQPNQFATLLSGKVTSGSLEVLAGSRLGLSSRVTTGETEGAALVTHGGYQLELGTSADISFAPPVRVGDGTKTELRLHAGVAKLAVLPLPRGSSLSVVTDDARVTVVGTAFSVEASPGKSSCVRVTEGRVLVERKNEKRTLSAGESSGCDAREAEPGAKHAQAKKSQVHNKTTLKEENQLLSTALAAERTGQKAKARRAFEQLLERYPGSPFAQDARAGLNRLEAAAKENE